MTAIVVSNMDKSILPLRSTAGDVNTRQVTDKYWSFLFIVLFIILVAIGPNTVRRKSDCLFHSDLTLSTKNTSELPSNKAYCKIAYESRSSVNKTTEFAPQIWGKNWLFDAITCNVAFLDLHYQKSGPIVLYANIFISVCMVMYAYITMRTDDYYRNTMHMYVYLFVSCIALFRAWSFAFLYLKQREFYFIGYSLPEIILFIIALTKHSLMESINFQRHDEDHKPHVAIGIYWYHPLLSILTFGLGYNIFLDATDDYMLNWDNQLSYLLIGISCYMCLIIYYYLMMVISCAVGLLIKNDGDFMKTFFLSWLIVARYHFGTICYHATLIFPRIHATFIMAEKEVEETTKISLIRRFYLAHWNTHDLSLMMTGANGHNYSRSIRELLKLVKSDVPKINNFGIQSQMFNSFTALLMAINSLLYISAYFHGVQFDSQTFTAKWVMYLIGLFFVYLLTKLLDAVSDTYWHYYDNNLNGISKKQMQSASKL